jgi:hypothetical protein
MRKALIVLFIPVVPLGFVVPAAAVPPVTETFINEDTVTDPSTVAFL